MMQDGDRIELGSEQERSGKHRQDRASGTALLEHEPESTFVECPLLHDHATSGTLEFLPALRGVRPQLVGHGLHGDVSS